MADNLQHTPVAADDVRLDRFLFRNLAEPAMAKIPFGSVMIKSSAPLLRTAR